MYGLQFFSKGTLETLLVPVVQVPVNEQVTTASRTAFQSPSHHIYHPLYIKPIWSQVNPFYMVKTGLYVIYVS